MKSRIRNTIEKNLHFSVIIVKGHAILVVVHYALKSVFKITVKLRG